MMRKLGVGEIREVREIREIRSAKWGLRNAESKKQNKELGR